jgi:ELWxxDGT repeat protein
MFDIGADHAGASLCGDVAFKLEHAVPSAAVTRRGGLAQIPNGGTLPSYPSNLTVIGGNLYFRADDGINGTELWKSDGTPAGTAMVKDINTAPGEGSQRPHPDYPGIDLTHPFAAIGGTIFFEANDGVHGKELWKTDGRVKRTKK